MDGINYAGMGDSIEYSRYIKANGIQPSPIAYREWQKNRAAQTAAQPAGLTPEQQARINEVNTRNQELAIQLREQATPMAQEQARIDRSRVERGKDLEEGRVRGEALFGEGSMGNLSPEVIAKLRARANGFTPEEQNAMRDNNLSTIRQNSQGNMRQLKIQQAQNGIRGGQAIAQRSKLINDQGSQVAAGERELFLKNIDARRAGENDLIDSEKFAIDLRNREKNARLATEMGYGGLGAADRGAAAQVTIGQAQADAAKRAGGGGGKK